MWPHTKYVPIYDISLFSLLAHKAYTPPEWCHSTTCLLHKKGDHTLLDNYRPIARMNNLLKLWIARIKDAGSKYAETHGILSDQHDGFLNRRSVHDALSSIIIMMEDAKLYKKTSTSCTRTSREPSTPMSTASCSNTCAN
jgi:hypothetical protein